MTFYHLKEWAVNPSVRAVIAKVLIFLYLFGGFNYSLEVFAHQFAHLLDTQLNNLHAVEKTSRHFHLEGEDDNHTHGTIVNLARKIAQSDQSTEGKTPSITLKVKLLTAHINNAKKAVLHQPLRFKYPVISKQNFWDSVNALPLIPPPRTVVTETSDLIKTTVINHFRRGLPC